MSSSDLERASSIPFEETTILFLEDGGKYRPSNLEQWWRSNNVLVQGAAGLLFIIVVIFLLLYLENNFNPTRRYLILVSIDGFRPDYLDVYYNSTTNLRNLADKGVKAKYLVPVFPTKTFPNLYTIVTGLYPESHGIVDNTMYDPVLNLSYSIGDPQQVTNGQWYGGEPIWVTAEKQNVKAGALFWPGSEAKIAGYRPSYFLKYNKSMPYNKRVEQVLEWLSYNLKERPTLITLYFENVDTEGHNYGPWNHYVEEAIREVDDAVGLLVTGIEKAGLADFTNYILLSDHGMAALNSSQYILLDKCIDLNAVKVIVWSPNAEIIPQPGKREEVFSNLTNCYPNHLTTQYKENLDKRYNYSHNVRIPAIISMADLGWGITTSQNYNKNNTNIVGVHGYDNKLEDMRAFFIGSGPSFVKGMNYTSIQNIDLYSLMTHLLQLIAAPNNGTWENLKSILAE